LKLAIGFVTLAALFACLPTADAQVRESSLTGSFVKFDRNLTTVQMWQRELAAEAALGHKILILPGDGTLMPSLRDNTGFTVNPQTLIYPSGIFPASPLQPDELGMLLTAADQFGMQVYIGSLQTYGAWSNGDEFNALHKYDPIIAREILARYGSHPSLNSGSGNWYFSHELWLNWVKFYGPGYYGISELETYVGQMKALSVGARVIEAPVFKKAGSVLMPGLSSTEAGIYLAMLASRSQVDIVAPQDGAGAQAGAPAVSELGKYYSEMRAALEASIASGTVQLWTTAETFQAAVTGTESANGWQPAPVSRISRQIAAEAPYVSQIIQFMYGWDMSPEATYTPVEADALLGQYAGEDSGATSLAHGTVSYSISPSWNYPDIVPSKLTNGTGGGFRQSLTADWVGFAGDPTGAVTVTVDLGGPRKFTGVRTLFAGSTMSGIYFPRDVEVEYSRDGGVSWSSFGSPDSQNVGIDTPLLYAVGWVNATNPTPVIASQVRVTVNFYEWLFIGEIKVMGS
jgi:Domain of unknown function (DUF4434)/F5/8 type C domain/Domain of unknown function (DUF5109)